MKNKLLVTTILIAAIVLVVNFISREFFFRLDFTEDNQYTLSNATKDILKNLKEPISIKAYFSEDLAPEIGKYRDEYKEMLIEYSTLSNGMLVYEFLNPTGEGKKDIETQAMQEGIQPFMIDKRENDKVEQQKAYMGVVISMGSQKEVIPVIPPGGAMEYETSKAIKKISTPEKPSIGLLQGHGEPGMQEMQQVYHELTILYNFEPLSLTDSTVIPERIKTIALVRPNDSIPQKHLDQLDAFMARGGRMLICMNRVDFNMQMGYGMEKNTGLEGWLQKKGLIVNNNFVYDINCASANVPQQMGPIQVYAQVAIPYVPIIKRFANHPAVKGLEGVMFKFVSSMDYMGDSSKHFTPLAFTSDQSRCV